MTESERRQLDEAAELAKTFNACPVTAKDVAQLSAALLLALRCLGEDKCSSCDGAGRRCYEETQTLEWWDTCDACNGTGKKPSKASGLLEALREARQRFRTIAMGTCEWEHMTRENMRANCDVALMGEERVRAAISAYESTEREGEK